MGGSFPYSTDQASGQGAIPTKMGTIPLVVADLPTPPPVHIANGGNWQSGAIPANGANAIAASAKSTGTGNLILQRYMDLAGTVPIGSAETVAMTANTLATAMIADDGTPFVAWSIEVANTAGAQVTLTDVTAIARS